MSDNVVLKKGYQEHYNLLSSTDSSTVYFTIDKGNMYLGNVPLFDTSAFNDVTLNSKTVTFTTHGSDGSTGTKTLDLSTFALLSDVSSGFKPLQSAVSDPTASGNSITFIDSISQNANGVISPTKKTVRSADGSNSGLMSAAHYSKLENIEAGAQVNQAAYSNVKIGSTTIAAATATDTLTLDSSNYITLTPTTGDKKVTINNTLGTVGTDMTVSTSGVLTTDNITNIKTYIDNGTGAAIRSVTGEGSITQGDYITVKVDASTDSSKNVTLSTTSAVTTHTIADATTGNDGLVLASDAKSYINSQLSSTFVYKGTVSTYAELPSSGNKVGDVWNITTADPTHGIDAGDNVAWDGTGWDVLGGTVDLSNYKTKQTPVTDASATTSGNALTFVGSVTQDANGVITVTKKTVTASSASTAGTMSAAHYTKLESIDTSAEVNQLAYSYVSVTGNTEAGTDASVSADTKTDTLIIEGGDNIIVKATASSDTIKISADASGLALKWGTF